MVAATNQSLRANVTLVKGAQSMRLTSNRMSVNTVWLHQAPVETRPPAWNSGGRTAEVGVVLLIITPYLELKLNRVLVLATGR